MTDGSELFDLDRLVELRHELHRYPEVANDEGETAGRVIAFLRECAPPDAIVDGLGGHGFAAVYGCGGDGPTVMVRSELDALPIAEDHDADYRSRNEGVGHQCGHDGHMAIVSGLGVAVSRRRPSRGRVVLLYQPAEETGEGARRILDDDRFAQLEPSRAFALHNLPGFEIGQVVLKSGVFASASRGMVVDLEGAPTHASHPADGRNPTLAATHIVQALLALPTMGTELHQGAAVTPIHLTVGQRAFGTSAGRGSVMMTLRAHTDEVMDTLAAAATEVATGLARGHGVEAAVTWTEIFEAVKNHGACQDFLGEVAADLDVDTRSVSEPFPWSEDFGLFTSAFPGAMFGLGAGVDHPQLHNRDYDFPDEIIATGVRMFEAIARRVLAE